MFDTTPRQMIRQTPFYTSHEGFIFLRVRNLAEMASIYIIIATDMLLPYRNAYTLVQINWLKH